MAVGRRMSSLGSQRVRISCQAAKMRDDACTCYSKVILRIRNIRKNYTWNGYMRIEC